MSIDTSQVSYVGHNAADGVVVGLNATVPVGFYGKAPVARQAAPAAATDAASVIVTTNALRTALINLGLIA